MALVFLVVGGAAVTVTFREYIFVRGAVVATSITAEVHTAVAPLPASLIGTGPVAVAQEADTDTARTLLPAASVSGGSGSPTPVVKAVAAAKKVSTNTAKAEAPKAGKGYFKMPTTGKNWGVLHSRGGVDIANKCGTGIYASAAGTVTSIGSGWNGGYGTDVIIKHDNGTETRYAHLQSVSVEVGEVVGQSELVGGMGKTGKATGCHLHFEIHGAKNPFVK